jgi:hypothetical protein
MRKEKEGRQDRETIPAEPGTIDTEPREGSQPEKEGPEAGKQKSRAQLIIEGKIEPEPHERGYLNLRKRVSFNQIKPKKAAAIRRKGAEAVHALHGEKKTARESLERLLTLKVTPEIIAGADVPPEIAERLRRDNPEATLYDLIQIVAVGRAVAGSIRAAEYVRDTHGDRPADRVQVQADIMTDADREMLARIAARIGDGDRLEIVHDASQDRPE